MLLVSWHVPFKTLHHQSVWRGTHSRAFSRSSDASDLGLVNFHDLLDEQNAQVSPSISLHFFVSRRIFRQQLNNDNIGLSTCLDRCRMGSIQRNGVCVSSEVMMMMSGKEYNHNLNFRYGQRINSERRKFGAGVGETGGSDTSSPCCVISSEETFLSKIPNDTSNVLW